MIEEDAIKPKTIQIQAQLPIEVATYLLNEKRQAITQIEQQHKVSVLVIPNQYLQTPQYKVERIKSDEAGSLAGNASYDLTFKPELVIPTQTPAILEGSQPAVKELDLQVASKPVQKTSLLSQFIAWVTKKFKKPKKAQPSTKFHKHRRPYQKHRGYHQQHPQRQSVATTTAPHKESEVKSPQGTGTHTEDTSQKTPYRKHYRHKKRRYTKPRSHVPNVPKVDPPSDNSE